MLNFDVRVSLAGLLAHMLLLFCFVVLCLAVHVGAQSAVFVLRSCVFSYSLLIIVFEAGSERASIFMANGVFKL